MLLHVKHLLVHLPCLKKNSWIQGQCATSMQTYISLNIDMHARMYTTYIQNVCVYHTHTHTLQVHQNPQDPQQKKVRSPKDPKEVQPQDPLKPPQTPPTPLQDAPASLMNPNPTMALYKSFESRHSPAQPESRKLAGSSPTKSKRHGDISGNWLDFPGQTLLQPL